MAMLSSECAIYIANSRYKIPLGKPVNPGMRDGGVSHGYSRTQSLRGKVRVVF